MASFKRLREGKSAGFEYEQTRSVQEKAGYRRSRSANTLDSARMVGEWLLAFMEEILADSLSVHSMTLRFSK